MGPRLGRQEGVKELERCATTSGPQWLGPPHGLC